MTNSPNLEVDTKVIAGTIILIVGVIGYVILAIVGANNPEAASIRGSFLFLLAPATALLVGGGVAQVHQATRAQNVKLDTIERQTNGALEAQFERLGARIETAADKAVQKYMPYKPPADNADSDEEVTGG